MDELIKRAGKDRLGGTLMILVGAGAAQQGITYSLGTLAAPGPGLFPGTLGVLLMLIGLAIAVTGKRARAPLPATAGTRATGAAAEIAPAPRRAERRGRISNEHRKKAKIVQGSNSGKEPAR